MASTSDQELFAPHVPVSWGELVDKICILEIKKDHASNDAIRKNIVTEFKLLDSFLSEEILRCPNLMSLRMELKVINQNIWDIEDEIRLKEARHDFGASFIELARNTYKFNDRRASIKRKINNILNSEIIEEKIY